MAKDSNEQAAAERTAQAIERALESIDCPERARGVADDLEREAGDLDKEDVAAQTPEEEPEEQAEAVCEKERTSPEDQRAAETLKEAAAQAARQEPGEDHVIDRAVDLATRETPEAPPRSNRSNRGRQYLRDELIHRLEPLDAADAFIYIHINHLPHPPWLDFLMGRLTWVMTGGHGWLIVLGALSLRSPSAGRRAALGSLPALWLTTALIEYGIKRFFRRRRPFISIMRAIVVGRKPGSFSFPSGHSAAAFAGAALLAIYFPRSARFFYGLASLTAFSRIYLGAHYPGDVISGSLTGLTLARVFHFLGSKLRLR